MKKTLSVSMNIMHGHICGTTKGICGKQERGNFMVPSPYLND